MCKFFSIKHELMNNLMWNHWLSFAETARPINKWWPTIVSRSSTYPVIAASSNFPGMSIICLPVKDGSLPSTYDFCYDSVGLLLILSILVSSFNYPSSGFLRILSSVSSLVLFVTIVLPDPVVLTVVLGVISDSWLYRTRVAYADLRD